MAVCLFWKRVVLVLMPTVSFHSLICSEAPPLEERLELVSKCVKARDSFLKNYKAEISIARFLDEAKWKENRISMEEVLELTKSGNQTKVEVNSKSPSGRQIYEAVVWNGYIGKTWIRDLAHEDPGSGRVVIEPPQYISDKYAERYISTISAKSWSDILEESAVSNPIITFEKNRTKVSFEKGPDGDRSIWTIWFEDGRLFTPSQWRIESRAGLTAEPKLMAEYKVEEFTQIEGVWLPKKLIRKSFDGKIDVATISITLTAGSTEDFDIKWPSGASIWDSSTNQGYVVP